MQNNPNRKPEPNLIDIRNLDPAILCDIRYATPNNFTKQKIYRRIRPLLQTEAATALMRVQARLRPKGLQLKIWDAYRPKFAQKFLWKVFPDERFVAHPKKNPKHCAGIAVDLTLADLGGNELPMPTGYDEFSRRAHRSYEGSPKLASSSKEARRNRAILEKAMEAEGFRGLPTEWWHFEYE